MPNTPEKYNPLPQDDPLVIEVNKMREPMPNTPSWEEKLHNLVESFKWGNNLIIEEALIDFISQLLSQERESLIERIKAFDITSGIHGEPVKNPLMKLEDVKAMIIQLIKEK